MNGRAWVVEVKRYVTPEKWEPWFACETRKEARRDAKENKRHYIAVRVRQYIRQPEGRP